MYQFPDLPYSKDALEPTIDARTMEFHYGKHHKAYYDKFLKAIESSDLNGQPMDKIFAKISSQPAAVRNNGGGYYNHFMFWNCMGPNGGGEPTGELKTAIEKKWGSFDKFKEEFSAASVNQFGSGWGWLILKDGELEITSTPNQDNPLMDIADKKGIPVMVLDVWEHAYYLLYQNRRPDFVGDFWKVVNWKAIEESYQTAKSGKVPLFGTSK